MPLIGIRNELTLSQLQIVPIKDLPIETTWSLIWLKGKRHGPAVSVLLDYLVANKSRIIQQHFDWYEAY